MVPARNHDAYDHWLVYTLNALSQSYCGRCESTIRDLSRPYRFNHRTKLRGFIVVTARLVRQEGEHCAPDCRTNTVAPYEEVATNGCVVLEVEQEGAVGLARCR